MKRIYIYAILIGILLMIACAQAEEQPEIFHAEVGSLVRFGRYEQDGNPDNGPEEIEWIALDVQNGKCLLLSRYCLDTKPYHSGSKNITWKDSSLRKWLNRDFLDNAFQPDEQEIISVTDVNNSKKQGYPKWKRSKGGKNTKDRIFLLSYAEASQYLDVVFHSPFNPAACAEPTAYAVGKGAYCQSVHESENPDTAYTWWWLRSPGYVQNAAAGVGGTGTLLDTSVGWEEACVRPALWVNLDKPAGIFLSEQPYMEKKTCGDYTYTIFESGPAEILRYSGKNDAVIIPEELDGHPVISIGERAFEGCSYVTSVTIPDGVTTIGDNAFAFCKSLFSVVIPDSVEVIGTASFIGCSELASVTIPDGTKSIGRDAFFGCMGLTSIIIPDDVEEIGSSAFSDCTGLTSVTIRGSVKTIGEFVFSSCTGLTSVTIQGRCAEIPDFAFSHCKKLKDITIPDSVKTIGHRAFWSCSSLTSVMIPEGVISIGTEAFGYCSDLHSVRIPASVTSIGENAFCGCPEGMNAEVDRGSYAEQYCRKNGIEHSD